MDGGRLRLDKSLYNTKKRGANRGQLPKPRPQSAGSVKIWLFAALCVLCLAGGAWWLTRAPEEKLRLREQAGDMLNSRLEGTPLAGLGDILRQGPPPPPPEVTRPPTAPGTLAGQSVTGTIGAGMDFDGAGSRPHALTSPNAGLAGASDAAREPLAQAPGLPPAMSPDMPPAMSQDMSRDRAPGGGGAGAASMLPGMSGLAGSAGSSGSSGSSGAAGAAGNGGVQFGQTMPPVKEDQRVGSGYLTGIARWLAGRYNPANGTLGVNVQSLNQRAGGDTSGVSGGRAGLLQYAFHPSMISGLYRLYIDGFLRDLDSAAAARGLDAAQNRQFHKALAGRAAMLASALDGVAATPDLRGRLREIESLAQSSVDINAQLTTEIFALDQLREAKAPRQQLAAAQLRVDGLSARYRRAMDEHENAQRRLAAEIRRHAGQGLDEDSLLFIAGWVDRRLEKSDQAIASTRAAAEALRDFAGRCRQ